MAYEKPNLEAGLTAELDPNAPQVEATVLRVTVKRDAMTSIPVDVREHEMPILEVLHGDDAIEVVQTMVMDVPDLSVDEEYDRLLRKYALTRTDVVEKVYPSRRNLADAMGVAYKVKRGAVRSAGKMPGSAVVDNQDPRIKSVDGSETGAAAAKAASVELRADVGLASKDDVKEATAEVKAARTEAGPTTPVRKTAKVAKPAKKLAKKGK